MAMYDFFFVVMMIMMMMRTGSYEVIESDRSWNF